MKKSCKKIMEAVKSARNGRSQEEFALEMGTTQPNISKYERGETMPPADVYIKCLEIIEKRSKNDKVASAKIKKILSKNKERRKAGYVIVVDRSKN